MNDLDALAAKYAVGVETAPNDPLAAIAGKYAVNPQKAPIVDNLNAQTLSPVSDSAIENARAAAGKFFADMWRGGKQLVGKGDQQEIDDAKRLDKPLMSTKAGMAGYVGAGLPVAALTTAIPGANTYTGSALVGAGMNALAPVATGESRLENAGIGALGGIAGQGIANGIGRAIRPVQAELPPTLSGLAKTAEAQGIPLNIAQKTGSKPLQIINSVLDNLPFTADRQAADKLAQRSAFNRAVLRQAGESSDVATPEVLGAAKSRIGGAFEDLSKRNTVALGDDFVNALAKIESGSNVFTKPAVRDTVDKALELAAQGNISGQTYQKVRSTLGKQAKDAFNSGNSEVGQALKTVQKALDDAATASVAPADKAAWSEARKQYAALKAIEKAAAPTSADAVAGNISPAKLASAIGDKNAMIYGVGDQTLPDLARIGQAFIKDQIPNSGTAQRQFYQQLMTNPFAAIPGVMGGASVPLQAFMRSKAGQSYLSQGLLGDGPIVNAIGNRARAAMSAGVPLGLLANAQE